MDTDREVERRSARDLVEWIAGGGGLPEVRGPVRLAPGETAYADLPADGWRFDIADVTYAEPRAVAIGGPLLFGLVAASSAAARRRARRRAEAHAAPQWRPLGALRAVATDRRLLVWHWGEWSSVWYDAIVELRPDVEAARLDMSFENDPPYCLAGPWVPYLTVVVTTAIALRRGVVAVDLSSDARVSD